MECEDDIPRYKAYVMMGNAILTEGHPGLTRIPYDEKNILPSHMSVNVVGGYIQGWEKFFLLPAVKEEYDIKDESLPKCRSFMQDYGSSVYISVQAWNSFAKLCENRKAPMIFRREDNRRINLQAPLKPL